MIFDKLMTARTFAVMALLALSAATQAAYVNIRSLESLLAYPTNSEADKNINMYGLWGGGLSQKYEYNMPFIELGVQKASPRFPVDDKPVSTFFMTIGNTNYTFSNLFENKEMTNSRDILSNGSWALKGTSSQAGIDLQGTVSANGQLLRVDFSRPVQPGEVVRFQVDINRAPNAPSTLTRFAPYTDVFYSNTGGVLTGLSDVVLQSPDGTEYAKTRLAMTTMDSSTLNSLTGIRNYDTMQTIPIFDDEVGLPGRGGGTRIPGAVPEPTSIVLVLGMFASQLSRCQRIVRG